MPNKWNFGSGSRRSWRWKTASQISAGAAANTTAAAGADTTAAAASGEECKVAFVHVGPTADKGWSWAHDQGRQFVEANMPNVKTTTLESIPEGPDSQRVFEDLAAVEGFVKTEDGEIYDVGICYTPHFRGAVGCIDFTNPEARRVYQAYLRRLHAASTRAFNSSPVRVCPVGLQGLLARTSPLPSESSR